MYQSESYIEIKINFFLNFCQACIVFQRRSTSTRWCLKMFTSPATFKPLERSFHNLHPWLENEHCPKDKQQGYSGSQKNSKGLERVTSYLKTSLFSMNCYLAAREGCKIMVFIIKGIKSATTLWTFCLYNCKNKTKH